MPKRYTGGVTDLSYSDPAGNLSIMDPSKYTIYHEDFAAPGFGAASVAGATTGYTGVWMRSGTANATAATIADAGVTGCGLKIDNGGANDNEWTLLQHAGGGLVMASGKKFFMETKFEITAATMTDHELFIGMASEQTTVDTEWFLTTGLNRTFDDGCGWIKFDGTDDIDFTIGENNVFSAIELIDTPVTATWYKASVYYDGTSFYQYLDDTLVSQSSTTTIPVTKCTPSYWFKSGKAEAAQVIIDYLTIILEN